MAITVEIPDINFKKLLPENFNECSQKEYIAIVRLLTGYQSGELSLQMFKALSIFVLMNIKRPKNLSEKSFSDEAWQNIYWLAEKVFSFDKENGFMKEVEDENNEKKLQILQDFQDNPIASFKIGFQNYIGPLANFKDATFGQYLDALNLIAEYHSFNEVQTLKKLVAIFYLPKYSFTKNKLSDKAIEKRTKAFQFLDPGILHGFYLYFTGFQIYLNQTIIFYNGQNIDMSILFEGKEEFKSDVPGLGMKSLLYSIAETGIYGDMEKVRNTNLWEILLKLYDSQKKAIDDKKQSEQTKPTTK